MQIRLQDTKVRKQIQITTFATFFLPDFETFGGSLGRSTVAHFARKVRGGEYCGGQARAENPTKSCQKALVMFATCSWPSLCEQSELQCWRRNRRLCGPVQISAAKALPLTFDNSILNALPLAAFVFLQEQGDRQGANGKHRPSLFRNCRVLYPSSSVCKKRFAKIKILYI